MVRDKLFRGLDIYAGFVADESKVDMQGWGSDHPILPHCVVSLRPKLVIEVGTWKGRSAINMARAMQEHDIDGEIVCIDTWLGSPENWLAKDHNQAQWTSLGIVNGFPTLYSTFLNNVVANNLQKYITPFPCSSEAAYYVLDRLQVEADLIYLDAGHEFESTLRDIRLFWKLLSPSGVVIFDDYIGWPGVTRAINTFAFENGLQVHGEAGKAAISRNKDVKIRTQLLFG